MEKKRVEWVDIGKYICIMFVMLSHLQSNTELLGTFYSPFFLTFFFFLAGYVYREPNNFKEHLVKKIKGLLVPWFIFSNFNILLSAIMSLKGQRNTPQELIWNMLQIRGLGDGLWFIAALFVAFVPFYFVIRLHRPQIAIALAVVLSLVSVAYVEFMPKEIFPWGTAALPWHLEYIFQAMLWMVLGYYFKGTIEATLDKANTFRNRLLILGGYLLIVYLPIFNGGYAAILIDYLKSIVGIVTVIMMCKVIKTNWYVSFVGANTLLYFALHGKVLALIEAVLNKFLGEYYQMLLSNMFLSSVLAVIITVAMSVILIIPSWIINRWFPWTLGRRKKRV